MPRQYATLNASEKLTASQRSYRSLVLDTGPVGYWRLRERSGTVARDEMGANNGTYVGSPTLGVTGLLAGDSDTAVTLNGTTQYVSLPAITLPTAAITWAAWANLSSAPSDTALVGRWGGGNGSMLYFANPNWGIYVNAGSLQTGLPSAGTHCYVGTWDGTDARLYVDGALVAGPTAKAGPIAQPAGTVAAIGSYNNHAAGTSLPGTLDEPAIWDRALTADEIGDLYAAGS